MKKESLLPLLFVLVFFHAGETKKQSNSWAVGNIIDWTTDIIKAQTQNFAKQCIQHAVRGAVYELCEDFGIESCQRPEEAHDSYYDVTYYCNIAGSVSYHAVKETAIYIVKVFVFGLKTSGWLLGYTLYYSGLTLSSRVRYLLDHHTRRGTVR